MLANPELGEDTELVMAVEEIDQRLALEYLRKGAFNRPLSAAHLMDLEARQRRGEWKFNAADALVFDTNDELRNGQHRLQMVLTTGIPMKAVVMRNAPVDSFLVYDDGRKRTLGDVLFINGESNSNLLGDTLKLIWIYLSRAHPGGAATKQQLSDLLKKHPDIRDVIAQDILLFQKGHLDRPLILGMHWLFRQVDRVKADRFVQQYVTGLEFDRGDGTDAAYVLRELINRYHIGKRLPEITRRQKMALFVSAFERIGVVTRHFRMTDRRGPVPEIKGFPKDLYVEQSLTVFRDDENDVS